jgi:isopenicillin N synthase-like dioxygenase
MEQKLLDEIPSLDLNDFLSEDSTQKKKFIDDLGAAYSNIGFIALKNHGLSSADSELLYKSYQDFFALPEEIKLKYFKEELYGQRGYIPKGKEHAKGRNTGDLKEFYHIGQELSKGDPDFESYPENIWPEEAALKEVSVKVFKTLESAGKSVLSSIALYLDLEEDYFEEKVINGNSILRPIHYYPIENPDEIPEDAVRAAEHGDINLITLLMGASAEGLQVLRRDGKWISITALPDQIVVNVGDMLERLTNGVLKSTIHRVVNPPKERMGTSRFSIPFFMHPRSEMDLTCLPECVSSENPKQFTDISAGEFLDQRLREIGLKK